MPKKPPAAEIVLGILVARFSGAPASETAAKFGYKNPKSISNLANRYKLDDVESKIRSLLSGQASEISPEAVRMNLDFDERFKQLGEDIFDLAQEEFDSDDGQEISPLDKMRHLQTAVKALEETRQARLKIAGITSDKKKSEVKIEEPKTDYADLLDECDEEDD